MSELTYEKKSAVFRMLRNPICWKVSIFAELPLKKAVELLWPVEDPKDLIDSLKKCFSEHDSVSVTFIEKRNIFEISTSGRRW